MSGDNGIQQVRLFQIINQSSWIIYFCDRVERNCLIMWQDLSLNDNCLIYTGHVLWSKTWFQDIFVCDEVFQLFSFSVFPWPRNISHLIPRLIWYPICNVSSFNDQWVFIMFFVYILLILSLLFTNSSPQIVQENEWFSYPVYRLLIIAKL